MKNRTIGWLLGIGSGIILIIVQQIFIRSDAQTIKNENKLKTDIKIEVKEDLKPELDKKLDKVVFEDHVKSQEKDEIKLYRELDQIQINQKETNRMLLELMKIAKK